MEQASQEWIQAKHATNELLGKVELLFRPFLRWLDRSLERLFTEGARQVRKTNMNSKLLYLSTLLTILNVFSLFLFLSKLKKDIDLEKAGFQFISYQELQATVCEKSGSEVSDPSASGDPATEAGVTDEEAPSRVEGKIAIEGEVDFSEHEEEGETVEEEASHLVENIKISDPRRGTEVKLLGLRLGENTATVVAQQVTVCLQCNRWAGQFWVYQSIAIPI